jgi:hypothetical protein
MQSVFQIQIGILRTYYMKYMEQNLQVIHGRIVRFLMVVVIFVSFGNKDTYQSKLILGISACLGLENYLP